MSTDAIRHCGSLVCRLSLTVDGYSVRISRAGTTVDTVAVTDPTFRVHPARTGVALCSALSTASARGADLAGSALWMEPTIIPAWRLTVLPTTLPDGDCSQCPECGSGDIGAPDIGGHNTPWHYCCECDAAWPTDTWAVSVDAEKAVEAHHRAHPWG